MPVLITETVRDDEYQRYLTANGYASKTATRPTFHSVKAGLAFDICKNVKGHEYDDLSFLTGEDRLQNKSAFHGNGRGGLGDGGVGDSNVVWPALNLDISKIQYQPRVSG